MSPESPSHGYIAVCAVAVAGGVKYYPDKRCRGGSAIKISSAYAPGGRKRCDATISACLTFNLTSYSMWGFREGFKNPSNGKIPLRGGGVPPLSVNFFPLTFWPAVVR